MLSLQHIGKLRLVHFERSAGLLLKFAVAVELLVKKKRGRKNIDFSYRGFPHRIQTSNPRAGSAGCDLHY